MKKLSLLLLFSISASSIFAMEDDAKGQEPFEFPKNQEDRIFTRSYRPPVIHKSPNAVVVDLRVSESDSDDSGREEPFIVSVSGNEDSAPGARAESPQVPDYTVTLGQEFIVAQEEGGTTKYRLDNNYSSTNLFELVNEYYANGPRTHYFVFKALCQGNGVLKMIGESDQPEQAWMQSYQVVVE